MSNFLHDDEGLCPVCGTPLYYEDGLVCPHCGPLREDNGLPDSYDNPDWYFDPLFD